MGRFIHIACGLLLLTSGVSFSQGVISTDVDPKDDSPGLYVKGLIKTKDDYLYNAKVTVQMDSMPYKEIATNHSGKFNVFLPLNHEYTIRFSNEGYVSKTISISTRVPAKRSEAYKFKFSLDLFETIPSLDVSLLEKPVAIVTFNNFMNKFDYDYNYTSLINDDIERLYAEYYKLKEK
jgi:hypothetical protein